MTTVIDERRDAVEKARQTLKDSILAAGVAPHLGVAILAAADSYRKVAVVAALSGRDETEGDRK